MCLLTVAPSFGAAHELLQQYQACLFAGHPAGHPAFFLEAMPFTGQPSDVFSWKSPN